ncbi:MAG TPA: pyrimidine utilization flavin reductase protein F [Pseudomonas sp.]|uniref:NADH-dependent FMN reductase RutF n=1 Tax=Stutzerimonas balearica TaxID=74829 RepID=UPI000C3A7DE5|nr:pyrimidine utilization flavin reductase protein F [Pseudomonas sp.]HAF93947.1 pyrimidine utilization flavin reductase protein F [Pseudomonas sp.]
MQLAQLDLATDMTPPVLKQDYRDAMARLAAAVNVITTDGPCGRAGFTATAVCSVTDDPPTLLVCLNRSASAHPAVIGNGILCINTLASDQEGLSNLFGGKTPMVERFAAANWSTWTTGAPVLDDAVASFECRISQISSVGTHDILYCEVLALRRRASADGLVYFDRHYHGVSAAL